MLNERTILKVISDENGLNLREISELAKVGKHERKSLPSYLQNLEKKGLIYHSNHRYYKGIKSFKIGKFDALALMKGYQFAFVKTEDDHIMVYLENSLGAFHKEEVPFWSVQ